MIPPIRKISRSLLGTLALIPFITQPLAAQAPTSTEPMGGKFADPKPAGTIRVLLVGAGSSHDFPKYFLKADQATLVAAGGLDVAATPNLEETLKLLPQADVLVFSGNHGQFGKPEFQGALAAFADEGKGLVFLHAATWNHGGWKGYNERFIGGKTPAHGHGDFQVTVKGADSPIMKGVSETFNIIDENYRFQADPESKITVLAENAPDGGKAHPSVWTVNGDKARIVCITLGHDDKAHSNPEYKTILTNAVKYVAGGK